MNKQVIRTVPVALLLINAVVIALTKLDVTQIIFAAISFGLLCCFVYMRSWETMTQKLYWLGLGALLIGILVPALPFPMHQLGYAFERFFNTTPSASQSPLQIISLIILLGSQIFLKKLRYNPILVIIRFAALYAIVSIWAQGVLMSQDIYQELILVAVSTAAATELCSTLHGEPQPATLRCFLFILVCIFLPCLVGPAALYSISDLIRSWLLPTLIVLGLAGLILAENHIIYKAKSDIAKHNCLSWALIVWALLRALMQLVPHLYNPFILYLCFPMAYCLSCLYATSTKGFTWPIRFAISGGCLLLCLLAIAHTGFQSMVSYALILILAGVIICLSIMQKKSFAPAVTNTLLGIAAIILTCSCRFHTGFEAQDIPQVLICVVLLSVMWGLYCNQTEKLHSNASSIHKAEFVHVRKLGWIIPLVLLGISFMNILFFL